MVNKATVNEIVKIITNADLLILAGGYEERAHFVCNLNILPRFGVIGIEYYKGPSENLTGNNALRRIGVAAKREMRRYAKIKYALDNPLAFEMSSHAVFNSWGKNDFARIAVDVSGMTQYVLMQILAEVRETWPKAAVEIIYIAALSYPPSNEDISEWLNAKAKSRFLEFGKDLIFESAEPLCPNRFAGTAQGRSNSVMILFAGYEKHRSHAAYDSVNPCRLVLCHSRPHVQGGALRLRFSQAIHDDLGGDVERSSEIIDNLDIEKHLSVVSTYYEMLYDIHDMVLVPVHSKMQSLACFLFWERYPDVQVMFALPLSYSFRKGGTGVGSLYSYRLPPHPSFELFQTDKHESTEFE